MRKVALVTGASRGIGKAVCAHLALEGYDLVVTSRSVQPRDVTPFPGTIMETAALVESLGAKALPIKCDVGKPDDVKRAVDQTLGTFGRVDLLINNARHEGPSMWSYFVDADPDELLESVGCNLMGPMMFCRLIAPKMIEQGGGIILNVTSGVLHSVRADPPGGGKTGLLYPMGKTGLDALTYGLVPELRPHKVPVIGLQPGRTLVERPTGAGADYFGTNLATRLTLHVPARVVTCLVTHGDPMVFSGQIVNAPAFAREHELMAPDEMTMPFRDGQVYDPYEEPYWQRLVASRKA